VLRRTDFEDNKQGLLREKFHLTGPAWNAVRGLTRAITRGHIDPEQSDVVFAFQRRDGEASGELAAALLTTEPQV